MTLTILVFVDDPDDPGELARTAISRSEAAAKRFEGRVEVRALGLDTPEAEAMGAVLEPTVVVGDLAITTGRAPLAGHVMRALQAALAGDE